MSAVRQLLGGVGGGIVALVSYAAVRSYTAQPNPPPSPPIPEGKIRICVAGYAISPPTGHARFLAHELATQKPEEFETWYYFDNFEYWPFAAQKFANVVFPPHLKGHNTSPFVWFERGPDHKIEPIGGDDAFSTWVRKQERLMINSDIGNISTSKPGLWCFNHSGKAPPTCYRMPAFGSEEANQVGRNA